MPNITASLTGITGLETPYWLIDFNNDFTVAWTTSCQYDQGSGDTQPCSESPLLLECGFEATTPMLGSFENLVVGGYNFSGSVYNEMLCLN